MVIITGIIVSMSNTLFRHTQGYESSATDENHAGAVKQVKHINFNIRLEILRSILPDSHPNEPFAFRSYDELEKYLYDAWIPYANSWGWRDENLMDFVEILRVPPEFFNDYTLVLLPYITGWTAETYRIDSIDLDGNIIVVHVINGEVGLDTMTNGMWVIEISNRVAPEQFRIVCGGREYRGRTHIQ